MQRFDETFDVHGVSPQQCFDYLADPVNGTDWASFANEIRAHGDPGVGRRIEARIGILGVTFGVDSQVMVWEEAREYMLGGHVPFRGELGARLQPITAGTQVLAFLGVDPGRFFPVPKIVFRKAVRRQFDKDVATLRSKLRGLA